MQRLNIFTPPFGKGRAEPDETGTLCTYEEAKYLIKEAFAEGYSQGSSDAEDHCYVPEFATKKYMDDLKV